MTKVRKPAKPSKGDQWHAKGAAWLELADALTAARDHLAGELALAEATLATCAEPAVREVLEADLARARTAIDRFVLDVGKNPEVALANYRRWQADRFAPAGREQLLAEAVSLVLHVARGAKHLAPMRDQALRAVMDHECDEQSCQRCARAITKARDACEDGDDGRNPGPSASAKALVAALAGVSPSLVHKACAKARGKSDAPKNP